jgi:hypothetical protein
MQRNCQRLEILNAQLGSVDISAQPDERTNELDESQVGAVQFVEAGKDAAKMLELVEAAFDEMPLAIDPLIVFPLDLGSLMRRNHRFTPTRLEVCDERLFCVAAICQHFVEAQPIEQRVCLRTIMALPGGQDHAERIA